MTSPLRRKRLITAAAPSTPARTAAKALAVGLLLAWSPWASAQVPLSSYPSPYTPVPPASQLQALGPWRSSSPNPTGVSEPAPPSPVTPVAAPPAAQPISPGNVERAGQPPAPTGAYSEEQPEYSIQLEPPGPERLFRLESERNLQERMRQEARGRPTLERIAFPEEPILSREAFAGRAFPPAKELVEPNYVCYQRLYFEQINAERYGWDLGFIHPFVSAGKFYWDLALLPYKLGTEPFRKCECSAGYCLPGDPVPLYIYPPELSILGTTFEAGTVVALFAIFPG